MRFLQLLILVQILEQAPLQLLPEVQVLFLQLQFMLEQLLLQVMVMEEILC